MVSVSVIWIVGLWYGCCGFKVAVKQRNLTDDDSYYLS